MIKDYTLVYDTHKAEACFRVDTDKFTLEHALETLDFFTWYYDKEANPIDEVMKKYAIEAIIEATFNNYNLFGTIESFNNKEGFCKIDGSYGIELTRIECFEFDGDDLEVTIVNPAL